MTALDPDGESLVLTQVGLMVTLVCRRATAEQLH